MGVFQARWNRSSDVLLNNLEAGRRTALLDLIIRTAYVLHVPTDYLLRDTVPVEPTPNPAATNVSATLTWQMIFKSKLVRLRQQHQVNQSNLAHALGLNSQAYISNLEIGRKTPSPEVILQIADLFGITTDRLLSGEE
jgi:transcriptional regulator with XRE-family HTH domain